jgi:hypothetical protein
MAQMKKMKINDMFAKGGYDPSGRADGPRHVSAAGQESGGVEGAVGLLQDRTNIPAIRQGAWRFEVSAEVA